MKSSATTVHAIGIAGWWGILGNCALLVHALTRLVPHALEPFTKGMSATAWVLYGACVVFMAYTEGYRGFQMGFSPRVIRRARALSTESRAWVKMLAPMYCFGLICAPRRRLIVGWTLLIGIVLLVIMVRQFPYPWRAIVDGGVVVGLSWGLASIILLSLKKPV